MDISRRGFGLWLSLMSAAGLVKARPKVGAVPEIPESVIEPDLPIVDAHHHLWLRSQSFLDRLEMNLSIAGVALKPTFQKHARYLFREYISDITSGHNIKGSVFVDSHVMYRANGPERFKSVGEIEYVNGVAAMGASGNFGDIRPCAGIVGGTDLTLGDAVEDVLASHLMAGGKRYRGIRVSAAYDEDPAIFGPGAGKAHLLLARNFRKGFGKLAKLGLSCDIFVLEPQLAEVIDLARKFPATKIILNHLGGPVGVGRYAGRRAERFPVWRECMRTLSECPNVSVKLSGLGMPFSGFELAKNPPSTHRLAEDWRPYIETAIETFGTNHCMFSSNFPVDSSVSSYASLWNTFKLITMGSSPSEKHALYYGTAMKIYHLDLL